MTTRVCEMAVFLKKMDAVARRCSLGLAVASRGVPWRAVARRGAPGRAGKKKITKAPRFLQKKMRPPLNRKNLKCEIFNSNFIILLGINRVLKNGIQKNLVNY